MLDSGNGLGNLADELAEACEDDNNDDADGGGVQETACKGHTPMQQYSRKSLQKNGGSGCREPPEPSGLLLSPIKQPVRSRHRRKDSHYDYSDFEEDSELLDLTGIPPSLEARLAAVESLACRGTELDGGEGDIIVQRVADSLKDLASQSGLEQGTTRQALIIYHPPHPRKTLRS